MEESGPVAGRPLLAFAEDSLNKILSNEDPRLESCVLDVLKIALRSPAEAVAAFQSSLDSVRHGGG